VFLACADQLDQLVGSIRPLDIVRVFWYSANIPKRIPPFFQAQTTSTYIDLTRGQEAIYKGMHAKCRYKVRRAEKLRDRFEIVMNTEGARTDFLAFYNEFVRGKGKMPLLKPRRFDELRDADVFVLYFDGEPACGRVVLRDEESRTALMLYTGTRRLDRGVNTMTIGFLNRYLHWHEMKTYQADGMAKYDFGGIGAVNPAVPNFKMSFGGLSITVNYLVYAGAAPGLWKLVHSLHGRWFGSPKHLLSWG
jgi:hypothetical protein